ncbi:unnamed protein product [Pleuronectes platessa]|uniref:Uncharacterized protein n=1 Tax=Pleuronectes platessa TaxID=8262 RepID=A0A9N7YD42_PLEPL|nr:unnamed protein product [Pleuronectes platessa]
MSEAIKSQAETQPFTVPASELASPSASSMVAGEHSASACETGGNRGGLLANSAAECDQLQRIQAKDKKSMQLSMSSNGLHTLRSSTPASPSPAVVHLDAGLGEGWKGMPSISLRGHSVCRPYSAAIWYLVSLAILWRAPGQQLAHLALRALANHRTWPAGPQIADRCSTSQACSATGTGVFQKKAETRCCYLVSHPPADLLHWACSSGRHVTPPRFGFGDHVPSITAADGGVQKDGLGTATERSLAPAAGRWSELPLMRGRLRDGTASIGTSKD